MTRQRRPVGTLDRATVAWKLRVRARMEEIGMGRAELARRIDCKVQAISLLLAPLDRQPVESASKLKAPIDKVLGLRDDARAEGDDLRGRFLRAEPNLDETQRAIIEATISATKPKV